ncbi:MAG: biotin/lipoyl-containing protein [Leptospiraceae bacterium]|nr:biotin/lipoyl-containing protein [Leptospiraceae bacterium]
MFDNTGKEIRFYEASSEWVRGFDLSSIKCLIVCRGPVRKEAMDVFDAIGIREYGILLSEKDSVVYPKALAPELRGFRFKNNIHRVPDYMGAGGEERIQRIQEIISIAKDNGYTHIFAGYGFMAEDSEFIESIEKSGVTFMGPGSHVAKQAGAKDEAKKLARKLELSVTPGVDNITALTLVAKAKDQSGLEKIAKEHSLNFNYDKSLSIEDNAENLLQLGYAATKDIISIEELQSEAEKQSAKIWEKYSKNRIRFKYIGGGGGKGQRVIANVSQVKDAVIEILAESKVTSVGSNRNFLIELNIENTRHNEIQLIGNGEWCIALGGRDCSLQMHEQKLLELSNTVELLNLEIENAKTPEKKEAVRGDLKVLTEMEEQSARFGAYVKLNSVSTFESIVEGTNHFFMEVNTRIQVEHRVTEMAYKLKFVNPSNANDYFIVESLIEAMAILSLHAKKTPKPERILRNISGGEVRVNATTLSLEPHAGGLIQTWSSPIEHEIRDDQGIGIRNPDTGSFIHYRLAGAYDSNVALIVTYGESREHNLQRLSNILRVTELRGNELQTNMPVHYGLINWILGKDPMFKPNTRFMVSYLAGVGSLYSKAKDFDLDIAWTGFIKANPDSAKVLNRKLTLIQRPIRHILTNPHILAGFIGFHHGKSWKLTNGKLEFLKNPILLLNDLYIYLNLEDTSKKAPSDKIWDHDSILLMEALEFYSDLEKILGQKDFPELNKILSGSNPTGGKISDELWKKCQDSHKAFQIGLELLKALAAIGIQSNFVGIDVGANLESIVPEEFLDPEKMKKFTKELNPPPKAKSDEIIAPMGGMYYSREAPNLPPMIQEGEHFKAGQPLFIIEVMKMFNKVSAPFSGTVVKSFMHDSDGKIVSKAQPIFKIQPDEILKEETLEEITARKKKITSELLSL